MDQLALDSAREAHRKTVHVDLVGVDPLRLEEDLVPFPMGKSHDLVFERRAIPRSHTADLPVEQRRLVDVPANQIVNALGRVEQVTRYLGPIDRVGEERKGLRRMIAVLLGEGGEVDASAVEPGRRARLQSAPLEAERLQGFREFT